MWSTLIGGVVNLIQGWFSNRAKVQEAKANYKIEELKSVSDYDTQAQRNMASTLKDEYLIVLHTFPIWGYMVPSEALTQRLDLLWVKLEGAPSWWFWAYMGMIISTFGLRFLSNKITGGKSAM